MMTILDAQIEESQVSDGNNWNDAERLDETYPEDTPMMKELSALRNKSKRVFTEGEKTNFIKSYQATGSKTKVCRQYNLTKKELDDVLKG